MSMRRTLVPMIGIDHAGEEFTYFASVAESPLPAPCVNVFTREPITSPATATATASPLTSCQPIASPAGVSTV